MSQRQCTLTDHFKVNEVRVLSREKTKSCESLWLCLARGELQSRECTRTGSTYRPMIWKDDFLRWPFLPALHLPSSAFPCGKDTALRKGLCHLQRTEEAEKQSLPMAWEGRLWFEIMNSGGKREAGRKTPWKQIEKGKSNLETTLYLRQSHDTYLGCRLPRFLVASSIKQRRIRTKGRMGWLGGVWSVLLPSSLLLLWEEKWNKILNRIWELFPPNHQW